MLYVRRPFSERQLWVVFPIKNIHSKPTEGWMPDKKELQKIKKEAIRRELTKIGNVHSHPLPQNVEAIGKDLMDIWEETKRPSETDLKFARKFNDIIRGIIVCDAKGIYAHGWHDQHRNMVELYLIELNEVTGNSSQR